MTKVIVVGHIGVTAESMAKEFELLKDNIPTRKERSIEPSITMEITNPYDDFNLWDIKPIDPDLDFLEDWNTGKKTGMKYCSMNDQKRAKLRKKRKKRKR